ncbi:MAG TPA: hypothetical protein VGA78_08000 [Gemmatimonadales bacterium]
MNLRTLMLPTLILAAACERSPSFTEPEVLEVSSAKGGGGKPKWIAFTTDRTGVREIWRVKPDAIGLEQLTSLGENTHPSWSPDGRKIVFTSYRDGGAGEIYIMNADGLNQRRITNNSSTDLQPDWSPDGSRIAFSSDATGSFDILGMKPDGSSLEIIARFDDATESNPRWSPDGKLLAFLSDRNTPGTYNVWVYHAIGSWVKQITFPGVPPQPLAWSPDSKRVLFHYDVGGGQQNIYGIDWETTQSIIVINSNTLSAPLLPGLAYSGTGDRLLYIGLGVGNSYLTTANLDGTDRKILTQSSSMHSYPVWAR